MFVLMYRKSPDNIYPIVCSNNKTILLEYREIEIINLLRDKSWLSAREQDKIHLQYYIVEIPELE